MKYMRYNNNNNNKTRLKQKKIVLPAMLDEDEI